MITFEELSQKYPIQNVAPYGACVVVPGAEFDPDWEVALGDQGYRCIMTDLDKRPVTLVQRKDARSNESKGEKIVYAPKEDGGEKSMEKVERVKTLRAKAAGGNMWKRLWTLEEDTLLIALWNRKPHLTVTQLFAEFTLKFPNRTLGSTQNRISALQQEGRIQARWTLKEKTAKTPRKEKATSDTKATKSTASDFQTLSEAYEALSKAYVDLKTDFDRQMTFIHPNLVEINEAVTDLKAGLVKHKHAQGSGEAMLPMEASK